MGKNPFPSIFYVYGNKTYEEEIKAYLTAHFNTTALNLSSSTGCGFKIESYDIGDLKALDIVLEKYEGWIQPTRRMEFNDLEADLLDLDKSISGCNQRITHEGLSTVQEMKKINFVIDSHLGNIAIRNLNFSNNTGVIATYSIQLGADTISGGISPMTTIDYNKLIKKNINGGIFNFYTNAELMGYVIEYYGNVWNGEGGYSLTQTAFSSSIPTTENISACFDGSYINKWHQQIQNFNTGFGDYRESLHITFNEPRKIKRFNIVESVKNTVDAGARYGLGIYGLDKNTNAINIHNYTVDNEFACVATDSFEDAYSRHYDINSDLELETLIIQWRVTAQTPNNFINIHEMNFTV